MAILYRLLRNEDIEARIWSKSGKCKSDKRIYTLITLVYGTEDEKLRLQIIARGRMYDISTSVLLYVFYVNASVVYTT